MEPDKFEAAKEKILNQERVRQGIGTLAEKTIHAVLKNAYEPDEDYQEIPLEGYVADIYKDGEVVEIQTRGFDKMRRKLQVFLPLYPTTIVYPIPSVKWLTWIDPDTGQMSKPRKSPLKGSEYAIFPELYKIKPYLNHENIRIHAIMIEMQEYRMLDGYSRNKKKGSHRFDRIPGELTGQVLIERREDFMQFVPVELEEPFVVKDFAKAARIGNSLAGLTLNILHDLDIVERIGKKGNAYVYMIKEQ